MQSSAKTVQEYLKEMPADRREAINAVRGVILANLPKGYEECMSYGMIGYVVPHRSDRRVGREHAGGCLYPPDRESVRGNRGSESSKEDCKS